MLLRLTERRGCQKNAFTERHYTLSAYGDLVIRYRAKHGVVYYLPRSLRDYGVEILHYYRPFQIDLMRVYLAKDRRVSPYFPVVTL